MAVSTRQLKAKSNVQEKWWTDEMVRPLQEGLDRLQNGQAMWQEVCALVEASVSRMSAHQSAMQEKCGKEKDGTKARKLEG